ncbi:glycosyltransferase family 32 protein [Boletus edulis BED1]|uniref:Glycosyltransferase family 32 protein n=1 Tax=Boletus edulis BED1 TaxID=1328754 RepID=A0AAD4GDK6_BOLED|nr:glycosyltransferase family 32 protein [Boletus edulis BED1]
MSNAAYERLPLHLVSDPARSHSRSRSRSPHRHLSHKSILSVRPRTCFTALKVIVPLLAIAVLGGLFLYEPHIELAFYSREWIQDQITPIEPLLGCFNPDRVSPHYNVSKYVYGPKRTEVHAGVPMRFDMDCYDFAATIQSPDSSHDPTFLTPNDRIHYHAYWRVDLAPFGERQEYMLKSFFATQNVDNTRLIMWSNGDLNVYPIIRKYLAQFPDAFELRVADVEALARGTPLDGTSLLNLNDKKAWIDGDLVRLLVVWTYGGVWIDMDSLLTRDLAPLLEHEFVTQWDCYDKPYLALNGALMHFHKHSPYLCEAFHIMATSSPPHPGSTDWGSLLYLKLWRRLLAAHIPPFKILPFCFSDARACRLDNRLPDPFEPDRSSRKWTMGLGLEAGGGLDQTLSKVFSVHLHNQWEKAFPKGGWVERLLLARYEEELEEKRKNTGGVLDDL